MIPKLLGTLVLGAVITFGTAGHTNAQITTSSSGCALGPDVFIPVGDFSLGSNNIVSVLPFGCTGSIALFIGNCLATPLPLTAPLACEPVCFLSCNPFATIPGPNPFVPVTMVVGTDPALINFSFCMQAACFAADAAGLPCVRLGDKTSVVVTP